MINEYQARAMYQVVRENKDNPKAESILHEFITNRNDGFVRRIAQRPAAHKRLIQQYEVALKEGPK